jgi:hypothetical protein
MNPDVFAEWQRRQGHEVVRTSSSYWYCQGPRVYQAFPYHWVISPTEDELSELLRQKKAIGLRYSTGLDAHPGCASYHAVYENLTYDLDDLERRARRNIRFGLAKCCVEPISFALLAEAGWALYCDTLDRQGRRLDRSHDDWRRYCMAASDLQGFEAWAALVDGRLAASLITFQFDSCCEFIHQQCHRDYLQDKVNNALIFVVTKTMTCRPGNRSVFYGLHSLDAPPSVDEFKFRMGYGAKPVRQRVVFHPALSPLFNRATHKLIRWMNTLVTDTSSISKAEGMIRFYLEGSRPIQEQTLPQPLQGLVTLSPSS